MLLLVTGVTKSSVHLGCGFSPELALLTSWLKPSFIGPDGWGGHSIRADFAERMLANDGNSPRRKATFLTGDEFLYEMEWNSTKGENLTRAELEKSPKIGIKDPTGLYGFAGYFANKFVAWPEDNEKGWYGFKISLSSVTLKFS